MRRTTLVLTVFVVALACDKSPTSPDKTDTPSAVTAVTVAGEPRFTAFNEVHRLTAMAQMSEGFPRDVSADAVWVSSDSNVVIVSAVGGVTAVGIGTATVSATYQNQAGALSVSVVIADIASQILANYRLAFDCEGLPEWARHREFDARIAKASDGSLTLDVTLEKSKTGQFEAVVRDLRLDVTFPTTFAYWYYGPQVPAFWEQVDATRAFAVSGTGSVAVHSRKMSGDVSEVRAYETDGSRGCRVGQMTLERR